MRMSDIEPLLGHWRPEPLVPSNRFCDCASSDELARRFENDFECVANPQRFCLGERQQAASNINDVVDAFSPYFDGIELESVPDEIRSIVDDVFGHMHIAGEAYEAFCTHHPIQDDHTRGVEDDEVAGILDRYIDRIKSSCIRLTIGGEVWFA